MEKRMLLVFGVAVPPLAGEDARKAKMEFILHDGDNVSRGDDGWLDMKRPAEFVLEDLPLSAFTHSMDGGAIGWIRWFDLEIDNFRKDGMDGRAEDYLSWVDSPPDCPVLVSPGGNGFPVVWDGFHRIGAAFKAGRGTVPALVALACPEVPAPSPCDDVCPVCGGHLVGDGYSLVRHCENMEAPFDAEPDSGPLFCPSGNGTNPMVLAPDKTIKARENDPASAFAVVPARDGLLAEGYRWALVLRENPDEYHDGGKTPDAWGSDIEVLEDGLSSMSPREAALREALDFYAKGGIDDGRQAKSALAG